MPHLTQSSDFRSIVLHNTPLIDVRAPIEFEKGAFPFAANLPLMSNDERHLVGIAYKQKGHDAAVALGNSLVNGSVKETRVKAWLDFMEENPESMLYCFRGGERSKISQEWIGETGSKIVRLEGGYKAFRTYLMQETERLAGTFKPYVIGGRTGSGKTILLKKLENAIDLEGLANHRGSSFGRKLKDQPTQIDFENALAYELIQKLDQGFDTLVFEDESEFIGRVYIPKPLVHVLNVAPLIILETSQEKRIEITFDEYIVKAQKSYEEIYTEDALERWYESISAAMSRIKRRLGGERYQKVSALFEEAFRMQKEHRDLEAYKVWIDYLLVEYYDPMYDYQIAKNKDRIVFRGSEQEIEDFLKKENAKK